LVLEFTCATNAYTEEKLLNSPNANILKRRE
jgi:hypothetical protein